MNTVDVVLQLFRSVEERNPQLAAEVYHDDPGIPLAAAVAVRREQLWPAGVAGTTAGLG